MTTGFRATRDSARHSAMLLSSVHWPGLSPNGRLRRSGSGPASRLGLRTRASSRARRRPPTRADCRSPGHGRPATPHPRRDLSPRMHRAAPVGSTNPCFEEGGQSISKPLQHSHERARAAPLGLELLICSPKTFARRVVSNPISLQVDQALSGRIHGQNHIDPAVTKLVFIEWIATAAPDQDTVATLNAD